MVFGPDRPDPSGGGTGGNGGSGDRAVMASTLLASLFLVAMPGAPNVASLLLLAMASTLANHGTGDGRRCCHRGSAHVETWWKTTRKRPSVRRDRTLFTFERIWFLSSLHQ